MIIEQIDGEVISQRSRCRRIAHELSCYYPLVNGRLYVLVWFSGTGNDTRFKSSNINPLTDVQTCGLVVHALKMFGGDSICSFNSFFTSDARGTQAVPLCRQGRDSLGNRAE